MATSDTRPRDTAHHSTSTRNKENVPHLQPHASSASSSPVPQRARIFRPSLVKSPDKQADFFTDSFLGANTSQTSLIPSPLPSSNAALSHSRKQIRPSKLLYNPQSRPRHRHTQAAPSATRPDDSRKPRPKPLPQGRSPAHSTGLSTPPRSREGSVVASPAPVFSSPPQALTETYTRIDQEEDLAATEGEISDSESEAEEIQELAPEVNGSMETRQRPFGAPPQVPHSRASTPTNQDPLNHDRRKRDENPTVTSVLSDPTGMSFADQFSDQNLRNTLTPHFMQSAMDREALQRQWQTKKPIAFGKAGKVLLDADDVAESTSSSPHIKPDRVIAFSKAGRIKLASDYARPQHHRTFSDVTEQVDRLDGDQLHATQNNNWHNDEIQRHAMPHNPRIQRQPYFPRNHGFPDRDETKDGNEVKLNDVNGFRKARSESPFTRHSQLVSQPLRTSYNGGRSEAQSHQKDSRGGTTEPQPANSEDDLTLDSQPLTQASSDIWAQSPADRPVQSIERNYRQRSRSQLSNTHEVDISPGKSRKFDIDFTGQSFQVSESPPVRTKSMAQDHLRNSEIRGLAKQAVTTNRLSQLRARESEEELRRRSRSPISELGDLAIRDKHIESEKIMGTHPVADRPTISEVASRNSTTPRNRSVSSNSQSHDILQRLARGSSSTPRSSTPSEHTIQGTVLPDGTVKNTKKPDTSDEADAVVHSSGSKASSKTKPEHDLIQATPKITGAWTDTILPDTIKTTRRNVQSSAYADTPHVATGGWIDTPAPDRIGKLETVQEVTLEVPAELMNGIVKDTASDKTILPEDVDAKLVTISISPPSQSLAKKVLHEAKDKLDARHEHRPSVDDSLVLGNATIQSLEMVLNMDDTEMTILSRLGEEPLGQSETEVLDRLGTKLDRLRNNIIDARKGITNLEHRISHPEEESSVAPTTATATAIAPTKVKPTSLPLALLSFSIPIPILWRRAKDSRLPYPTLLGWITLFLWAWYILECTFCEIYSHPRYATKYSWPAQAEPEFPFVLPIVLWRWSRLEFLLPWVVRPLQWLLVGTFRTAGMWLGLIDGFTDGPAKATLTSIVTEEVLVQSVHQGFAGGYDMMSDELL